MSALGILFGRARTDRLRDNAPRKNAAFLASHWFRCLVLVFIGVIVRSPALQGERIWDDLYLSRDNPFIKSPLLILETFRHYLFLDSFSAHYRPVQNVSYLFDYFFWNTDEFGFHLTNVILHVGSGILLYFLLRHLLASLVLTRAKLNVRVRLLRRLPWVSQTAFLVALLWTVHPVHSAAIDYISGRADSLAFFFAAAGWLLFLRARQTRTSALRLFSYFLAASCGLLALLSREIAIVWLVLFLAHLFCIETRLSRRFRLVTLVCCAGVILLYGGFRHLPRQRPNPGHEEGWQPPVRAMLMMRALGDYGRLMFFPSKLHMERTVFDPGSYRIPTSWRGSISTEYLSILGLGLLAVFASGSVKKGRGQTVRIFGASWFLGSFLPISNIVQLNATVAEHWLYLPSVGLLIFLAGCSIELPLRYKRVAIAIALLASAALGARSYVRSTDWVSDETFYRRTLAAGGTSARTGLNLGQIYANRGQFAEAEKVFRKVLEIAPGYPIAQNNLANVLYHEGKNQEAEALFAEVQKASGETRKEYPRTWVAAVNFARMRYNAHDYAAAFTILERARNDYPQVWEIISFESEILRQTQGPQAAFHLVEDFAHENWWHHSAALALGRLYAQDNDPVRAEKALRHASWLDVHDTEALRLIVLMQMRQNRLEDAMKTQRRAVSRQPDQPRQYVLLSDVLERMGRSEEARATLAEASRLRALAAKPIAVN